ATMASVNAEILNNSVIVFPGLDEQQAIATYLDRKCAEIDTILDDKRRQVENMKNHRKSVIYEYVTGKKRVKEV
ncbi:MAG: restriction endonuclease subunit S, partial [Bacillota bacterium]|nr:restriction endonuclease subunit S [Bacillota bacterium]